MEIIKRGVVPEERPWHGTCHYCGSEVRAKQAELEITEKYGGTSAEDSGHADCPVCARRMTFHRFDGRGD